MVNIADGIFYFALMGAGVAATKHYFMRKSSVLEFTPVAAGTKKDSIHPAAEWWGGYAFGCMNAGYFTIGLYGALIQSDAVKKAYLLGTGVLFASFSASWLLYGGITGLPTYQRQSLKIGAFASLFFTGFYLMQ
jgi:hypothetical protein